MNWRAEITAEFTRLGKHADASVVEELAQHAADAWEAVRAEGESPQEADARVHALVVSLCHATSGPRRIQGAPVIESTPARRAWLAGLGLDIRLVFRLLYQQPGFALISIALVALGIAATTSIFSVVNGVLLKPPTWSKAPGLVRVFEPGSRKSDDLPALMNVAYHVWAKQPETIDGLGAWESDAMVYDSRAGVELVRLSRVTASLFPLIGASPAFGAGFTEAHEGTDGKPRTIIGVMPRGFEFPDRNARVWLPQRVPPVIQSVKKTAYGVSVAMTFGPVNALARLKPGVTAEQAATEGAARVKAGGYPGYKFMADKLKRNPEAPPIAVISMLDWSIKEVAPALWILLAAVVLLLGVAVGNVANMQLARSTMRTREVAIRSALGAGGGRLLRQLFLETSMIAVVGGAIGVGLTLALLRVLPTLMPEDFPRVQDIAIDGRVLGLAAALTLTVAVAISLLPARLARRVRLTSALAEDSSGPVGQSLRSPAARSRTLIITGQVAIAALLLVGAALLLQSFLKMVNVERGYRTSNLLTARITHPATGLPKGARAIFFGEVLDRMRATPGVTHVALSIGLPLTPARRLYGMTAANRSRELDSGLHVVSADYFASMGMRLVRGREFTAQDGTGSELVVLVNETFANRYLPGEPLNAVLHLDLDGGRGCAPTKETKSACTNPWRVVGVVADVRHNGTDESARPEVFAPRSQFREAMPAEQYLTVRTTADPARLAAELRTIVRQASATAALDQVMTMETRLMKSLARPRLYAVLLSGFATFALVIAVIGLLGGLSYGVTLRTREIGVRTALGATPRHIVGMVMKQGTIMTVAGLAIGLGVAAATVRYLSAFLFGVEPLDPRTFVAVGAALTAIAIVACAIPARRAARIDPITALRH
jgi:putative ABC transport system permease protein